MSRCWKPASIVFPPLQGTQTLKLTLHNFIRKTQQNLREQSAVESIKEQVRSCSRCSVNKIMPSLVPGVLESSIKLSENFVIVCVFAQKMGRECGEGWGKVSCQEP